MGVRGKKIAFVIPNMACGGAEKNLELLSHVAVQQGIAVDIVCLKAEGELLENLAPQVRVVDLKLRRFRYVPRAFAHYLQQHQPDWVFVNMWPLTCLCILGRVMARSRTPLSLIDHNNLAFYLRHRGWSYRTLLRLAMAWAYRVADDRIAVSQGVANQLADFVGMARKRWRVIHNPVRQFDPVKDAANEEVEAAWATPPGKRILSVGALKEEKNFPLLIEALVQLESSPDAVLMILGEGALREPLTKLAQQLGVADRVRLPGFCANPMPYYASADLFILSSNAEGFGNVIVEALSADTPVIATDCDFGPAEILQNGRYGTLVSTHDVTAMVQAIEEHFSTPKAAQGRPQRAKDFDPEVILRQYLQVMVG
jgi:glycosyltransferase involved in cell wall biosynthesis